MRATAATGARPFGGTARAAPAPLLFGFGQDGQGALPWLAQNLSALFTVLLSLVLIALLALLVFAVLRELRRRTVFLDPIGVPEALRARGFTPEVVAEKLLDALLEMQARAPTNKELRGVDSSATLVDLQMPGRFSLQSIVRYLHRALRIAEPHVGGEITIEGDAYALVLRNRDQRNVTVVGTRRGSDIAELLRAGAMDILRVVDPWVLAQEYFALDNAQSPRTFARTLDHLDWMVRSGSDTDRPWALNMRGICLLVMGRLDESVGAFADASRAGPELTLVHSNWAIALERLGRSDEAREHRLRMLKMPARTPNLIAHSAVVAATLHRRDEALAFARRAMTLAPVNANVWAAWGVVLLALHRVDEARQACERAKALGARDAFWALLAGWIEVESNDGPKALAAARKALGTYGDDDLDARTLHGAAQRVAGDTAAAIATLEGASAEAPYRGDTARELAQSLLAAGRSAEAAARFERAATIDADDAGAWLGWGCALALLGRHAEAVDKFAVAARLDPDWPLVHREWARALASAGRAADTTPRLRTAERIERRHRTPLRVRSVAR